MKVFYARRWADLPLRGKALVVISLPLVVLLLSLVLIYITERQTARAEEDVRRVLRVQGDIRAVHTLLAEAAASVRGYLLTRREDFLPSYRNAKPQIESALRRLDGNVRDQRVREQLAAITPLINSKIDGLEDMLGDPTTNQASITTILVSNKHILDALRQHIGTMLTLEDSLLAERTAAAAETRQRLLLSTWLAAICGLFGAIVAVLFLSKGIVARVQNVQGNAQRLALGQPLLPQPPENDEIGQLGTRLVEAGMLLAERERALRENEERLRLIIDGVKDYGIFALDTAGHVTSWNAGAERIKGYTEEEILGQHFSVFYLPQECPQHPAMALAEATRNGDYMEEGWRCRQDGTRFWASVVITAQFDATGALRGFSKITRDITDRRAAEIALGTAREEAERASRAKSEFLSRMSHELRTPLNAILGFAQLLDMDAPSSQKAQIGHILRAGQHLLTLINEVLDIAKIEAGRLPLNIESIPLAITLHEALTLVSPMASDAGIQLKPVPALAADLGIVADRQRLTQVLLNLLSNAIKYNRPQGQVSIEVEVEPPHLRVSVCDTGNGIALDSQGQLFKPFERLGADPNVEGSGLGLALSKSLLEMMQGSLNVQSQVGSGSRFTLALPYARLPEPQGMTVAVIESPTPTPAPALASPATQGKVLCIEDNLSSLALIETLLQRRPGIKLLSSMQGQLGLDLAAQHAPQLIVLDVSLPDIDGLSVLRRLRQSAITRNTPVLMITADASTLTRLALHDAGATAVLSKPINVPSFLAHLDHCFPEPV
ncbi:MULTISPECIES: ATP-binding protein [Pseudomonas]|uniref:histidine kinase n=1 Tax=Pseudomonas tritici TaxID=2745518 RepID=A0A8H9Z1W5_9PSED|nr:MULTISPECIES: ATP-binding protein [Pseudomonas]MBP2871603.1 CHASE3 domain-containing protein [Pseudomonas sp. SWRI144]MBW8129885.1 PAS domain S-box protein [Pseudomonas sp. LAP_36]MBW8138884.1 PAS domain S-box protein [Pseudomonas sp. PAMC 26818]QXH86110.1 CHASE3 domain-containing protein [Pseudomonas tritici]CRM12470.1 Autoinducer 2 sensor kinase/phosphatase LuxQ [Pseudomonas sp. 35 E 8]